MLCSEAESCFERHKQWVEGLPKVDYFPPIQVSGRFPMSRSRRSAVAKGVRWVPLQGARVDGDCDEPVYILQRNRALLGFEVTTAGDEVTVVFGEHASPET
jgi:hypothetical protein